MKVESLFFECMECGNFEELPECEQLRFLERHAFICNYEIRLTVAEKLGNMKPREEVFSILKRMIWDKDELVAAEAIDSLGAKGDASCLYALKRRLRCSRSKIVKGYAAIAIAEICARSRSVPDETLNELVDIIAKEKDRWLLQNYYCAMYIVGQREYLGKLLAGQYDKDYRIRAVTKSMLKDFVQDNGLDCD